MKGFVFIFLFVIGAIFFAKAQIVTDITQIDNQLTEKPWLDHSVHEINGYKITKIFGERYAHQRHSNLGSITSIAYLDKDQLGKDSIIAGGGAIQLFITRATESRANFKWFFVVIRGEDDNEKIMEIDLEYQASQLPEANGWWNFTTVLLPKAIETPFYVYINDRQSQHLSDFKFLIKK